MREGKKVLQIERKVLIGPCKRLSIKFEEFSIAGQFSWKIEIHEIPSHLEKFVCKHMGRTWKKEKTKFLTNGLCKFPGNLISNSHKV